jgi:hypothetical protein
MYYLIQLGCFIPTEAFMWIFLTSGNKTSVLCTNVNGPRVPYRVGGIDSIKATTFMPNLADIPGGFAMVSHVDRIWISFSGDIQRCPDAKEIIKLLEQTLDGILASK